MSPRPHAPEDRLAEAFFAWHQRGELRIQRCDACHTYLHPPRVTCPRCHARSLGWHLTSGDGSVFSWIVNHRALSQDAAELGVYVSALVELDEGPRVLTRLLDVEPCEVTPGMRVSVAFEPDPRGTLRAMFRPTRCP